ncbi:uncharacterized protein LOC127711015 isoform X2 [Mytilus californianus]|uniref:uncharacterized protein LOC127711015 isoform X2 n=1 Tax=Mytilus californianus TaxID=6549 RepID=UPI00224834F3|nr:uncharacterized protein LOC127711015 isoform X2 [Mytilus californianus]
MEDNRLENCDEFDEAFPMKTGFCQLITKEQFEDQAQTETEKALQQLMEHLDTNPELIKELLKKRKREDEEEGGFMSYMKLKMLSMMGRDIDARYTVSENECEEKISQLKDGMSKAFMYSLESKGRRYSKRLAAKKHQKSSSSDENIAPSIPVAPPLPPPPGSKVEKVTRKTSQSEHEKFTPTKLRTPLKDRNQIDTPQSLRVRKEDNKRGSIASMGTWQSIGSLSSLHEELLSINPNKLLRPSIHPRSPGGTPKKKPRSRGSPSSTCNGYSTATPLYKALINGMHQKFRNVRSPSPAVYDSDMSEGFTP